MAFKVYETKPDKDVFFKLVQSVNSVTLVAVNSMGEKLPGGSILSINKNGIVLHLGFDGEPLGIAVETADEYVAVSKDGDMLQWL